MAHGRRPRKGASVVVLDDGFQHRRLARDLDIVLVAASTPARVRLLPRGPFREDLSAVAQGRAWWSSPRRGEPTPPWRWSMRLEPFLREPPVRVSFVPQGWTELDGEAAAAPEGDYLAVCGIGDPDGFSRVLADATGRPGEALSFPDHHDYSWGDVQEIQARLMGRTLVTTEKDAVKLHAFRQDLIGATGPPPEGGVPGGGGATLEARPGDPSGKVRVGVRVHLLCVGDLKGSLRSAVAEYEERVGRYWRFQLSEVEAGIGKARKVTEGKVRTAEEERLLARIPKGGGELVALTREGKALGVQGAS